MSRVILIQTAAVKGSAHRALGREVEAAQTGRSGEEMPDGMTRALAAAHHGATKLISAAGRSDMIEVQIQIAETPAGGWQASVLVDVPTPTFREPPNA